MPLSTSSTPGSIPGCALPDPRVTPLLEVRDLRVSFRTEEGLVQAVDRLSLSVGAGEVLGIVGESGSGKTVSMMAVMRLIRDPNAIVEKLNREINAGLASEKMITQLGELGTTPIVASPDQFWTFARSETEKWEKVIRQSGVKVD